MNVTVKKLVTFRTTDMDGVDCDVYINGVNVGQAHDDGMGGELNFWYDRSNPKIKQLVKELEDYVNALPEVDWNADKLLGAEPFIHKLSVEDFLNDVINAALKEREDKKDARKREKAYLTGIVYGMPNSDRYSMIYWKKLTLADMLMLPGGKDKLQARVNVTKMELKKGEVILNADYLKSLRIVV